MIFKRCPVVSLVWGNLIFDDLSPVIEDYVELKTIEPPPWYSSPLLATLPSLDSGATQVREDTSKLNPVLEITITVFNDHYYR